MFARLGGGQSFVHDVILEVIFTALSVIAVQLVLRETIGRIVRRLVKSHKYETLVEEQKREDTLIGIFRTTNAAVLWIIGVIIILSELHVNLAALVTGAGLIGVVVGLGAQNVIKDYLAGLFIIIENQYRVGDIITLNGLGIQDGVSGVVEDISIRITKLRDLDGNLHFVRNGLAGVISNRTFSYANINLDLAVSYAADIDVVEKVINATGGAMAADELWRELFVEPIQFLRVESFNESSVTIKSLGRVRPGSQWEVSGEFRRRIKKAFEKHGFEVPFPQVVVRQRGSKKG